jgi:hypothetical protein
MKSIVKSLSALALIILTVFSCTERIDVELEKYTDAGIVVEGAISTDTMAHKVILTKTAEYFHNSPSDPVTGAVVTISTDSQVYTLTETPASSGIYLTDPDVYGEAGKTYYLKIELEEALGGSKIYEATDHIFPINPLDSIALRFYEDWGEKGFWEVKCYTLDPPTEDFYLFQTLINGKMITDSINLVFVVDDLLYNGNYTNGIGVNFLDQAIDFEVLNIGDTVKLRASRVTKFYAEYIWKVQEEISYQTPLFSGPPANVHGNISNGGFGFFAAYASTYASVVVPAD